MQTNNKLREALETLVDLVDAWKDHLPSAIEEEVSTALDKANAALDEPVRNYEVGTVEEQLKRQYDTMCNTKACPDYWSCRYCFAKWAQLPYVEKEGGAK